MKEKMYLLLYLLYDLDGATYPEFIKGDWNWILNWFNTYAPYPATEHFHACVLGDNSPERFRAFKKAVRTQEDNSPVSRCGVIMKLVITGEI